MQNGNIKANKFQKFLDTHQINCFGKQEMNDELHTVIFRTQLEIDGQQLPVILITDDSLHTPLQVRIAPAVFQGGNAVNILAYINELNSTYKNFKFFINPDHSLVLDICLTAVPEQFEPQLVSLSLDMMLQYLTSEYPVLMRKIWTEDSHKIEENEQEDKR